MVRHHLTESMRLRVHPAVKDVDASSMLHEEFFSEPGHAWEPRIDNGYPTVLQDPATGVLRLYYTQFIVDPVSARTPLGRRAQEEYIPTAERVTALCLAESVDGVVWTKPELGLVDFDGSTANNILMVGAHGTGIMLDPDDPEHSRLYKMVTRIDDWHDGATMAVAYSADGVHFTEPKAWVGPAPRADSHNAPFRDPVTGDFAITTRIWKDGARVCVTATSADFEHWSELSDALRGTPPQDQVYSMPVFRHHGHFIGLASIYHEGDRAAADFDLVDCELATAHDLDSWVRVAPGQSFIERGAGSYPTGAFDSGCIYAACPIEIDGVTWVYYFGGNGRHTGFRETALGRARVDLDRLAGYEPTQPGLEGRLVVGPFDLALDDLEVLAEVRQPGAASWRLVDPQGRLPLGVDTSLRPLGAGDGWHRLPVTPGELAAWEGRAVCIDLHINEATLFAVRTCNTHQRFR